MPGPIMGTRHTEIQMSLHALPKGLEIPDPICVAGGGTNWLETAQGIVNHRQRLSPTNASPTPAVPGAASFGPVIERDVGHLDSATNR